MTRACLLLQPTRTERLLTAEIDDRFDATFGEPSDVMGRGLSGAPSILRYTMPVIADEPHKPVVYKEHFRVA